MLYIVDNLNSNTKSRYPWRLIFSVESSWEEIDRVDQFLETKYSNKFTNVSDGWLVTDKEIAVLAILTLS